MHGYPKGPAIADPERFYADHSIAVMATVNPDGTAHAVPVVYTFEQGEFLIGTQGESRKARNIMRDPRTTLVIDERTQPFRAATIYGMARIDRHDVDAARTRILGRIMPVEEAAGFVRALAETFDSLVIRFHPYHAVTVGFRTAISINDAATPPSLGET